MSEAQAEECWQRDPNETAEEYVERVGGWQGSPIRIIHVLRNDFGLPTKEAKDLVMNSRSVQVRFLSNYLKELHARGGTKYAAMNYVRRRSSLSELEAIQIIDSVGEWSE